MVPTAVAMHLFASRQKASIHAIYKEVCFVRMGPRHQAKPVGLTQVAQLVAQIRGPDPLSCIPVSPLSSWPHTPSKDTESQVAQYTRAACGGAVGWRVGHRRRRPRVPLCCAPKIGILTVPFFQLQQSKQHSAEVISIK